MAAWSSRRDRSGAADGLVGRLVCVLLAITIAGASSLAAAVSLAQDYIFRQPIGGSGGGGGAFVPDDGDDGDDDDSPATCPGDGGVDVVIGEDTVLGCPIAAAGAVVVAFGGGTSLPAPTGDGSCDAVPDQRACSFPAGCDNPVEVDLGGETVTACTLASYARGPGPVVAYGGGTSLPPPTGNGGCIVAPDQPACILQGCDDATDIDLGGETVTACSVDPTPARVDIVVAFGGGTSLPTPTGDGSCLTVPDQPVCSE